jgi:hypothetical protein
VRWLFGTVRVLYVDEKYKLKCSYRARHIEKELIRNPPPPTQ